MVFEILGHGFENGPTERYEFKVALDRSQGPSWSTDILIEIAPKFFQSVTRCRAIHPGHDCQCIQQAEHKGGYDSRHRCWHSGGPSIREWPAWQRGKRDLVKVESKRNLIKEGEVMVNPVTFEIHIEHAHVG